MLQKAVVAAKTTDVEIVGNEPQEMIRATKEYKCSVCSEVFDDSRALGGHFSKAHKGMSAAYNKKMEVRNARTSHRDALYLAKELLKRHGSANYIKQVKRFYLTQIRNIIM